MRVVIGLGANLGDRAAALRAARAGIAAAIGDVLAASTVYENPPVGPPQPDYLNAALLVETSLPPDALLDALLAIERSMGRVRQAPRAPAPKDWTARTLDLDVLWIDGRSVVTDNLTVPHPHLTARAFALGPLLEVAPDARDPATNARYADVTPPLDRSSLRAVDDVWL